MFIVVVLIVFNFIIHNDLILPRVNLVKAELQYLLVMRSKLAFSASQLPHLEYRYNIIIYEVMNINFLCLGSVAQCV